MSFERKGEEKTIGVVVRFIQNDPFNSIKPLHEIGLNTENSYFACFDTPRNTEL